MYDAGPKAKPFIEKYFEIVTIAFTALLILGYFLLSFL